MIVIVIILIINLSLALIFVLNDARGMAKNILTLSSSLVLLTLNTGFSAHNLRAQTMTGVSPKTIQGGETPHTLVIVIGESANKRHFSSYGYMRDTTPGIGALIERNAMILVQNAYANHTHRMPSLSLALTAVDQQNPQAWLESPSLVGAANHAGITTYWISNQQMLGACDNQTALWAESANTALKLDNKVSMDKPSDQTAAALIEPLKEGLSDARPQKLIVLDLTGNGAKDCLAYPDKAMKFPKGQQVSAAQFGALSTTLDAASLNCYDNDIANIDAMLSQIVALLAEQASPASLLFFSAHSKSALEGDPHKRAQFNYSKVEIPMLFWANQKWRNHFDEKWQQLHHNRHKLFTSDHIYDTALGLLGISGSAIDTLHDLSSRSYETPIQATTLHGAKPLKAAENWGLWQHINVSEVNQQGLGSRLMAHRVNSIGKAKQLLSDGLFSFEMDVHIRQAKDGRPYFEIGHGHDVMSGLSLRAFLQQLPAARLEKLWLDVKNATPGNIQLMVSRLEVLDQQFNLKAISIIETSMVSAAARALVQSGFHSSYYLPTKRLSKAMKAGKQEQIQAAIEMAVIIKTTKVAAVSFDLRLYPFVTSYLRPLIKETIDSYHSWHPGVAYRTPKMLEKLATESFFQDPQVKTILVRYRSPFHL